MRRLQGILDKVIVLRAYTQRSVRKRASALSLVARQAAFGGMLGKSVCLLAQVQDGRTSGTARGGKARRSQRVCHSIFASTNASVRKRCSQGRTEEAESKGKPTRRGGRDKSIGRRSRLGRAASDPAVETNRALRRALPPLTAHEQINKEQEQGGKKIK